MADLGFYASINTPAQMQADWASSCPKPESRSLPPQASLTRPQGFPTCPGSKSRCQPPTEAEPPVAPKPAFSKRSW